jgi:CheY-like chemotaxis protein
MKNINLAYIIDDDDITIYLADNTLKKVDFCETLEKFTNGQDALARLRFALEVNKNLPEVVLFDLDMPGMDGWEFIEEFSKLPFPKEIPAFVFTSSMDHEDYEKAKAFDVIKGVILKPLNIQKINKILRLMDMECVDCPEVIFRPYNQSSFYLHFGKSM